MVSARPRILPDPNPLLADIVRAIDVDAGKAAGRARAAVRDYPDLPMAHRVLARALRRLGNVTEAERAELKAIEAALRQPPVAAAQAAFVAGKLEEAEQLIRPWLRQNPEDAAGAALLGSIAERCDAQREAENLYRRALLLAPAYLEAHMLLAKLLNTTGRHIEAQVVIGDILERDARHLAALALKANIFVQLRQLEEANVAFKRLVHLHPRDGRSWMNFAYLLKTQGNVEDAIAAYRRSVELEPARGNAWWGLANLKTFTFVPADVAAMRTALGREDLLEEDRIHLHFALGKALGDTGDYAGSFEHYAAGNRLRLEKAPHDPDRVRATVRRIEQVFTPAYVAEHKGLGCRAPDPIFIVSLPRSGSTLVEQILASHPLIEGTEELYDIERIALELVPGEPSGAYLDLLAGLDAAKLQSLGEHYLAATRRVRKTDRPYFTDKLPGNWVYIALIHSILPNAKIVDIRRHPMGCGLANFTQHFNWGINFAYDLRHIGNYYRQYVRLMRHFDTVMPGRIHHVIYENLVADTEGEVRRLLDYLELPFDAACLRFFENRRAVHTPSAEQVRRPINRDGMDRWRHYEPWLGPLAEALGPVLEHYPDVPGEGWD